LLLHFWKVLLIEENMYAIVDIAGQQFKVEQGQEVIVHRLEGDEGTQVTFNEVLLLDAEGKISVGTPVLEGAFVSGKILSHLRGDKVLIFKKKRRKGYQKMSGHRDDLTRILIEAIAATGGNPVKKEEKKAEIKAKPAKKSKAPVAEIIEPQAVEPEVNVQMVPVVDVPEEVAPPKPVRKRAVKKEVLEEGVGE
jgi:large subunit ribosomal protein L21